MAENWYVYYPKSKVGEETIQFRLQDRAGNYYTTMVVDVQTFLKGRNRFPCANGESYPLDSKQRQEIISLVEQGRKEGKCMHALSDYDELPQMQGLTSEQKGNIFDLVLFAVNTETIMNEMLLPLQKNMYQKYLNGEYDELLAEKALYQYLPKIRKDYEHEAKSGLLLSEKEKWIAAAELRIHLDRDFAHYPNGDLFYNMTFKPHKKKAKPKKTELEKLEQKCILRQHGDVQFTPPDLAEELVAYARLTPESVVLEPSAGIARIAEKIRQITKNVHVIEIDEEMRALLKQKGFEVVGEDFLQFQASNVYDAIIMNPPFSKNQDIIHLKHAFSLLKPGGRLVCLTSAHWRNFGSEKITAAFQKWLEGQSGFIHELSSGTFEKTDVKSYVITITKPVLTAKTA